MSVNLPKDLLCSIIRGGSNPNGLDKFVIAEHRGLPAEAKLPVFHNIHRLKLGGTQSITVMVTTGGPNHGFPTLITGPSNK